MVWYVYIAWGAIVTQLLFLLQTFNNCRYALSKYNKKRPWHKLRTVLIIPCRGLDADFEKNISSFYKLDYDNYRLWFVVSDVADAAYEKLQQLKTEWSGRTKARDVRILVAGPAQSSSQKIHNLLYAYRQIPDDTDVLAFADSDICVRSNWLSHLVWPLRKTKYGASTGYRWFVPKSNNLATIALSALNAKIAQLLGNTRFNQAWGGSMAIRVDVFRRIGLEKIWLNALSDDLTLTYAVKKAGLALTFVPACLTASYQSISWAELFEFGRRQFLITRVYRPATWLFGFFSSLYSVLGLWGGSAMALYAARIRAENLAIFLAVPVVFFVAQLLRAILRQKTARTLLSQDRHNLRLAAIADISLSWFWSLLLFGLILSSAFGRTITWRGIRYKLPGPTQTIVVTRSAMNKERNPAKSG